MKGTLIFVQSHTAQTFPEDLVGKYFFVGNMRRQITEVSVAKSGTIRIGHGTTIWYKLSEIDLEISHYEAKENN